MSRCQVKTLSDVCDQLANPCDGLVGLVGAVSAAMVGMSNDTDVPPMLRQWLMYTGFQLNGAVQVMGEMERVVEGSLGGRVQVFCVRGRGVLGGPTG